MTHIEEGRIKSVSFSIYYNGADVDQVDIVEYINKLPSEFDITITSYNQNEYLVDPKAGHKKPDDKDINKSKEDKKNKESFKND